LLQEYRCEHGTGKSEEIFWRYSIRTASAHFNLWTAKRTGEQRQIAQDRVPQARIYKVWNIPQWGTAEFQYLKLLTNVLASGKISRLYKRLGV